MLRRYELTDEEWNRIAPLLPPENTGKQGRPRKDNRILLNGMVWLARSGAPWRDLPERYGSWQTVYSRFRKWIDDGILDNIFRILSLEAELEELSIDASIVQAHQHSVSANFLRFFLQTLILRGLQHFFFLIIITFSWFDTILTPIFYFWCQLIATFSSLVISLSILDISLT